MKTKFMTKAMAFFLAVLMSFTLIVPETFASSSNDYNSTENESVVTIDGTNDGSTDEGIKLYSTTSGNSTKTPLNQLPSGVQVISIDQIPNKDFYLANNSPALITINDSENVRLNSGTVGTDSNYKRIDVKVQNAANGWTITDPFYIDYPNLGTLDGKQIGATINIDKIVFDASVGDDSNNDVGWSGKSVNDGDFVSVCDMNTGWTSLLDFGYSGGNPYTGQFEAFYTVSMYWYDENAGALDKSGVIDLPFAQVQADIDSGAARISDGSWYLKEMLTLINKSDFSAFYIYDQYNMYIFDSSANGKENISFQSVQPLELTDGNDSYYKTGVTAATKTGKWSGSMTSGSDVGSALQILSFYNYANEPEKTTTNGTVFNLGDTVDYQITQKMAEMYVDVFNLFGSMSFIDSLPDGLSYVDGTAKLVDSSTGNTIAGTPSYDKTSNTLVYDISSDWLSNSSNYNGQNLVLTFKAEVNMDPALDGQSLVNSVLTSIDGINFGPAKTTITIEIPPVDISVEKVWQDSDNLNGIRPNSVTVGLTVNGTQTDKTLTLNSLNNWSGTFEGLDKYVDGKAADYGVYEVSVDENYNSAVTGSMDSGYVVTNSFEMPKINIPVEKIWDDDNNANGIRPGSITVGLTVNGTQTDATLTLSDSNNWSGTFEDLDVYIDGDPAEYDIYETGVANYTTDITGDMSKGFTITNTFESPAPKVTKTADKSTYAVGETVYYTVTITQDKENTTDYNVTVTDVFDSLFTDINIISVDGVSGESIDFNLDTNTATVVIPEMNYGDTAVIKMSAVLSCDAAGEEILNTVNMVDYMGQTGEDTVTIDVLKPDVSIEKAADSDSYFPYDKVTYTLIVAETEKDLTDFNVEIADTLNTDYFSGVQVENISGVSNYTDKSSGNDVDVIIDELSYGQTVTITVSGILSADSAGATIPNTAVVTDYYGSEDEDTCNIEVLTPNVSIDKAVYDGSNTKYNVGDIVYYVLTVTETAKNATDYEIVVSDTFPDHFDDVVIVNSSDGGSVSLKGNEVTAYIPELSYGDTFTIVVSAVLNRSAVGETVSNTAYVQDYYENEDQDTEVIEVLMPDIGIEKSVDKKQYNVGETAVYTLTVSEIVEDAIDYDVVVRDPIPAGLINLTNTDLEGVDGEAYIDTNTNELVVNIPVLKYGDTATVSVSGTVSRELVGETFENVAYIEDYVGNTGTDRAEADVYSPVVNITKDIDGEEHNVGETVTYTMVVTETVENAVDYGVVVTDVFDDGLDVSNSVVTAEGVDGITYQIDGQELTVKIPVLKYGESVTITATAVVTREAVGQTIDNVAVVTDIYDNQDEDNAVFTAYTPDLDVSKEADGYMYNSRDTVTYTVVVDEANAVAVDYGVIVTDIIPEGLDVSNSVIDISGVENASALFSGQELTVYIPVLRSSETAVITFTAYVEDSAQGMVIENTATVTDIYHNIDSDNTEIEIYQPLPLIDESVDKDWVNVGEFVSYRFVVTEPVSGSIDYDLVVTDTFKTGLNLENSVLSITVYNADGSVDEEVTEGSYVLLAAQDLYAYIPSLRWDQYAVILVDNVQVLSSEAGQHVDNDSLVNDSYGNLDGADADFDVYKPEIEIVKEVNDSIFNVGDYATYTFTVTQPVEYAIDYKVVMTDVFDESLDVSDAIVTIENIGEESAYSDQVSFSWDDRTLSVNIPVMYWTDTYVITIENVLITRTAAGEVINNSVVVADDYENTAEDDVDITVRMPGINILKDVDDSHIYNVGDELAYTLMVNESAEDTIDYGVVVTDPVPAGLDLMNSEVEIDGVENASYEIIGQDLTVYIPTLSYEETAVITFTAEITSQVAGSEVENVADVIDIYNNKDSDDAVIEVYLPDISIEKTVSEDLVNVGDIVDYTIIVSETVENAVDFDVVVTDIFNDGLSVEDAVVTVDGSEDITYEFDGQSFSADIPVLMYDEPVAIMISGVYVTNELAGQVVPNTATAADSYNNVSEDEADIEVYMPDISVTKEADKEQYEVGETVTYTMIISETVENAVTYDIELVDTFDQGFDSSNSKVTISGAEGASYSFDGQTLVVDIPVLVYGETAEITATAITTEEQAGTDVPNIVAVSDIYGNEDSAEADISVLKNDVVVSEQLDKNDPTGNDTNTQSGTVSGGSTTTDAPKTGEIIGFSALAIVMLGAAVSIIAGMKAHKSRKSEN